MMMKLVMSGFVMPDDILDPVQLPLNPDPGTPWKVGNLLVPVETVKDAIVARNAQLKSTVAHSINVDPAYPGIPDAEDINTDPDYEDPLSRTYSYLETG